MKKTKIILMGFILLFSAVSIAQNDCTLEIGQVDISGVAPDSYIDIPVTMPQIDGVVMGWEFYILFDNTVFTANTDPGDPNYFLQDMSALFPGQWFENIVPDVNPGQDQFAANWLDPSFVGVTVPSTEILFNLRLQYVGGLNPGEQSDFTWNFSKKKSENYQVKGVTAVVNGAFGFYNILPVDGYAFIPDGGMPGLWTGAVDGNWFNSNNWDDGMIPGSTVSVTIPATAITLDVVISDANTNGTAETMALNMETGTSLTISFDGELTTHGDFINDGAFIIESESTDGFAGSYINMGVIGGSGTFEFQRDVLCTGTTPGSVDPFGWHYLAAPIDGLSTDDLPEYFINVWDQPNGAWNQYSSGDCTPWPDTPLDAGAVWSINVDVQYPYAQCPGSPAPNGTLIRFEGSAADVHTGPFNTPLGYGTGEYQEWNLVANPYPSGLDLNSVVWGPNTVAGAAFFDGCSGNYTYWTPAIGSYSMAPSLGFFVETTGVGDAFAVDNSNRAHGADWFWKDEIAGLLSLEAAGSEKRDVLHVRFMDNVTAGFDNNGDFHKLFSNSENLPQIYTTAGAHKLAINALPETSVVPMGFTSSGSGSYTIRAIETSEFQQVYLQDLVTGEVANLLNSEYTFNYSSDDNADRFLIHFSPVGMGENLLDEVSIWSGRNKIYVDVPADRMGTIEVYSMMGQEVAKVDTQPGTNVITVRNVNTYYVVKVISSKGAKSGKVYVQ